MDPAVEEKPADTVAQSAAVSPLPSRILVRSSNWLGDAVMTVPAVRAVKRANPRAHVAILTQSKLADFWKLVPEVDVIVEIKPGDNVFSVAKKIRNNFDMALLLPNSVRSALEVFLAKIPRRVGYKGKSRRWLLNEIVPAKEAESTRPRHQFHHYLDLAEFAGAKVDGEMRRPEKAFSGGSTPGVETSAGNVEQRTPGQKIKIGLCPGAEYGAAKRWLPERYAEVVNTVSKRRECEWLLFGTQRDKPVGDEITSQVEGDFTDLIGKTTLAELIAELTQCHLLLTNDTGTMHLAAFLGIPTVSIFGSTEPLLTGPLGGHHRILRHHVECSPCFLRDCPLDFRCMRSIEADEVIEAVLRMLEESL